MALKASLRFAFILRNTHRYHKCLHTNHVYGLSQCFRSRFSTDAAEGDPDILPAEPRRFNNLYLDISKMDESFPDKLDYSISKWSNDGVRAVWAYTPSAHSQHIPMLITRGFDFHYAGPGFVLMSKWMSQNNEPNKLPHSPSSIIGVAGIVHNARDEVLLVQEKASQVVRKWKFPGGLANFQEDIDDAIKREILEETGIRCNFQSVLGFRHQHNVKFGGSSTDCLISDLYIVCRLTVDEEQEQKIRICEKEIYDAQWIPLKEFVEDIDSWPINKEFGRILYENLIGFKAKHGAAIGGKLNEIKLPCDLSITQLSSVAVPGSSYKLYRSQTGCDT